MPGENLPELEDPLVLLKLLSAIGHELKFVDHLPSLHPENFSTQSLETFLDAIAYAVVDRPGQCAVAARSLEKRENVVHTTLYLAFGSDPPANVEMHLQSIFSLLKNVNLQSDEAQSGALTRTLSRLMYGFSWKRWVHDLYELLERLGTLQVTAPSVAPELMDTLDKLGCLGKTLKITSEADSVEIAMKAVEEMHTDWVKQDLFAGRWCGLTGNDCDSFQFLALAAYRKCEQCLYFVEWIDKIISILRRTRALVKIASSTRFSHIFEGTLNVVVLAPPSPLRSLVHVNIEIVPAIISRALETVEGKISAWGQKTDYEEISLRDPRLEHFVQSFTAWVIKKMADSSKQSQKHPRAHPEKHLLSYLDKIGLLSRVDPYFGTSEPTCANCFAMIVSYAKAKAESSRICVGEESFDFYPESELPDFGLEWHQRFVRSLQEEIGVQVTAWMNLQERSMLPDEGKLEVWSAEQYMTKLCSYY
ncbi:hypothetical protein PM082_015601 [Marasmius tenuissimus]|nr:hypothetical protein PM082_015601 [Marasmius tenuissimus]